MRTSIFDLGQSDTGGFVSRRGEFEPPEFDITAMVDLVFMMNIYFIVTFVTVAGALNLPTAKHVSPLDAETAAGREKTCPNCRGRVTVPSSEAAIRMAKTGDAKPRTAADHPLLLMPHRTQHRDLIDMTAMVDIVFFLLIFFLVTSMQSIEA